MSFNMEQFLQCPDSSIYMSDNYVVLDFETTNKDKGSALNEDNSIVYTAWSRHGVVYDSRGNEYHLSDLVSAIDSADFLVAHNAKFELQWLVRCGLDLSNVLVYDTLIGDYVIHGNKATTMPLDLGNVAQRYGMPGKEPFVDKCMKGGVCPSDMPFSLLSGRCRYDIGVTERIFLEQRNVLKETGKLGVMLTRCLLTPVLADIEKNGVCLSAERVTDRYMQAVAEDEALKDQLKEFSGSINMNSPKQVAELLYDELGFEELKDKQGKPLTTGAGGRKADKGTIAQLKPKNKKQKQFLELKLKQSDVNAELTKTLNKFKECVDNGDLLYAGFNQTRTVTHRLSSSGKKYGVQFQNFPRKFKPLITARHPGWKVGEIDGAQLEFRVAAFLGQDSRATQDIRDGVDVHSYTSSVLTDNGQETDRQGAKAHTFKPLYGGESGTKAEKAYYAAFKDKYQGIAKAQQAWIESCLQNGSYTIANGMQFYFPDTRITKSGHITNKQSICNYAVQSFATADIIPIALVYLWHALRRSDLLSFITNTVHDSAIMEIHPEEIEEIHEIALDSFTYKVYNYLYSVYGIHFNVPLGTGYKVGDYWGEGEEVTSNVEPPETYEECA